ncbi:MAG TPA: alkaline phosphatase family protein [Jatrophihabitans sp.]|nr:alkaline phosphatase family protein [Jatrophihabitans sp.]
MRRPGIVSAGVAAAGVLAASAVAGVQATASPAGGSPKAQHVLLLSIDGMHQSDLSWYVENHPSSALAKLVSNGSEFTNAKTTFPSDSFPGMVAQLTGGGPGTTGVYYDDTYNHALLPPGSRDCTTANRGTEVPWTEAADRSQNPITLDAGQGLTDPALTNIPTNSKDATIADSASITTAILKMTPTPQSLLDPAALPVDPATCTPLYPHQYIRVNTVFNVARAHGLQTAWSDKHPAYEILNGRAGTGVQDLFTPEINSVADSAGDDWTTDNALTQEYDSFKVAAIINEIDGFDHSGTKHVGVPAIFGMNFQTLSTAQKLPTSDGLTGGYHSDGTPQPLVARALGFVNTELAQMETELADKGLANKTVIILSAKHGQSPIDPDLLRRVDDGAIIDAINAAWKSAHPGAADLVAFAVDDDGMLMWLSDHSAQALEFAKTYLLTHSAPAGTINDGAGVHSTTVASSGLTAVYTGAAADAQFGAPVGDTHAPDLLGIAQHGVVYTGGVKKISEHGGAAADDRHVPLVVSGDTVHAGVHTANVLTTQVAPTILQLLGLDPHDLQAVRAEHTQVLPVH